MKHVEQPFLPTDDMNRIKRLAHQGHYIDSFLRFAQEQGLATKAYQEADRNLRKVTDFTVAAYLLGHEYKFGRFNHNEGKIWNAEFFCAGPEVEWNPMLHNMGWDQADSSLAIDEDNKITNGRHRKLSRAIVEAIEDLSGMPMTVLIARQKPVRPAKITAPAIDEAAPAVY